MYLHLRGCLQTPSSTDFQTKFILNNDTTQSEEEVIIVAHGSLNNILPSAVSQKACFPTAHPDSDLMTHLGGHDTKHGLGRMMPTMIRNACCHMSLRCVRLSITQKYLTNTPAV